MQQDREAGRKAGAREPDDPRAYLPGGPEGFSTPAILATFHDEKPATDAAAELRSRGFSVNVDQVGWRPSERGDLSDQPWPESLTGPPAEGRRNYGSLDTAIYSQSEIGGDDLIAGHNWLLTAAVEEGRRDEALGVIRGYGGEVDEGGPR